MDLPGSENFNCPDSVVPDTCTIDIEKYNPKWMCLKYNQCIGYVYNSGTKLATLKKSFQGSPEFAPGLVVYAKRKFLEVLSFHVEAEECAAEDTKEQVRRGDRW